MGLTGVYNSPVSEEAGIAIIKEAFNQGITFFDTADVYGPKTNEILVGKVFLYSVLFSFSFSFSSIQKQDFIIYGMISRFRVIYK